MWFVTLYAILLTASAASEPDNLVLNPRFEEGADDQPAHWSLYVAPQTGSLGRIDRGSLSAVLQNAMPYPREPYNNWSQNIEAPPRGTRMLLSGRIKTEEATEALLWAQCWRRHPLRLLYTASVSTSGTREWNHVETEFTIPANTTFITVRCVLRGVGTAWFDDISVRIAPEKPAAERPVSEGEENAQADGDRAEGEGEQRASPLETTGVALEEPSPVLPEDTLEPLFFPTDETSNTFGEQTRSIAALEADMMRMREVNLLLIEALERMELRNEELLDEVLTLRDSVLRLQDNTAQTATAPTEEVPSTPPPIVPHGENWRAILNIPES